MRNSIIATVVFSLAIPAVPARALVVECANCASEIQQLLGYARQAEQLANEVSSLKTQLAQYANMVTNTVSLPTSVWADVQGSIGQVRSLANQASVLTGNAGGIVGRLNALNGYANQLGNTPADMANRFTTWQRTIGNAASSLGRTLGVQQGQENNATALQVAIQEHLRTAEGQKQAIQAAGELAALTNFQLQQVQTTLTTTAQMQAASELAAAERQAVGDTALTQFLSPPPFDPTTGKGYGY